MYDNGKKLLAGEVFTSFKYRDRNHKKCNFECRILFCSFV